MATKVSQPVKEQKMYVPSRPEYLNQCDTDHLYLVTVRGQWPVWACSSEKDAIATADAVKASDEGDSTIYITKIAIGFFDTQQIVHIPATVKLVSRFDGLEEPQT